MLHRNLMHERLEASHLLCARWPRLSPPPESAVPAISESLSPPVAGDMGAGAALVQFLWEPSAPLIPTAEP
jgi:hypothetical protein